MRNTLAWGSMICCLWLSCGDMCKPDLDNEQPKALRINPGILVKDSIDASCDPVDWKDFSYYEPVRVTVTFAFGELFKPHGVEGEIRLFRFDGNQMQQQPVVPETRDYTFVFVAEKDRDYFFRIEARNGAAGYMIETKVEPLDPCSQCGPGTTCCRPSGTCCPAGTMCRDGACVRVEGCSPPCDRGEVCEGGTCVPACNPPCKKPKRCDPELRRCVGGDAPPPREAQQPKKRGCSPPCREGQTCNEATGECEGGDFITGSVLSVTEEGGGSILLINRGSQDGVKRGASGTVSGYSFTIKDVSATRCKAFVNAKPDKIKTGAKVRIAK